MPTDIRYIENGEEVREAILNRPIEDVEVNLTTLFVEGIPGWSSTVTYETNSLVQENGVVYRGLSQSINSTPSQSPALWERWEGNRQATLSKRGTVTISNSRTSTSTTTAASSLAAKDLQDEIDDLGSASALKATTITAGNGITGGGNLSSDRTVSMGTPSTVSTSSSNSTTSTSHTHAIDLSGRSITAGNGITGGGNLSLDRTVTLGTPSTVSVNSSNSTTSTSHTHTIDLSGRSITAGDGLSGGGDLSSDRTVSMGTPSALSGSSTNSVTSTSHTHELWMATTSEAVAGNNNTNLMTPLRTHEAFNPKINDLQNQINGVVTSGSNSNGYWVRWNDGTQATSSRLMYGDIVETSEFQIHHPQYFTGNYETFVTVDTEQFGVVATVRNRTYYSVSVALVEPNTNIMGGEIFIYSFGRYS